MSDVERWSEWKDPTDSQADEPYREDETGARWFLGGAEGLNALQAQADLAAGYKASAEAANRHEREIDGELKFYLRRNQELIVEKANAENLAAGLRAKAELADDMAKALRDPESLANADWPLVRNLLARYNALNPQPHHEGGEG